MEGYEQRESSTSSPLIAHRESTGSAASNSPAAAQRFQVAVQKASANPHTEDARWSEF
jgi:hypothetical protein